MNDVDGDLIFAQQTLGYGKPGDVLLGISTSGNSKNVMCAAVTARALGMKVAVLSGRDGGCLGAFADAAIVVPERETFKIQELHLPVYHALCPVSYTHLDVYKRQWLDWCSYRGRCMSRRNDRSFFMPM